LSGPAVFPAHLFSIHPDIRHRAADIRIFCDFILKKG